MTVGLEVDDGLSDGVSEVVGVTLAVTDGVGEGDIILAMQLPHVTSQLLIRFATPTALSPAATPVP